MRVFNECLDLRGEEGLIPSTYFAEPLLRCTPPPTSESCFCPASSYASAEPDVLILQVPCSLDSLVAIVAMWSLLSYSYSCCVVSAVFKLVAHLALAVLLLQLACSLGCLVATDAVWSQLLFASHLVAAVSLLQLPCLGCLVATVAVWFRLSCGYGLVISALV